jgi:hypothetical protein
VAGSELFDLECEVGVVYGAHTHTTMRAFINGELLGEDSLANMAWTFEELLSFASRGSFVGPTDPLASGTHQRGCLTEIWDRAGELSPAPRPPATSSPARSEALGLVTSRVVDPHPCSPIPVARRGQPRGPATEQAHSGLPTHG